MTRNNESYMIIGKVNIISLSTGRTKGIVTNVCHKYYEQTEEIFMRAEISDYSVKFVLKLDRTKFVF